MDSVDRLPDDMLVHILSFMSTRDCVQSSVLGKRWRFLWARVPNLKFDSGDHKTLTSFSNFVNRFVFIHKGQSINTFRIKLYENAHMGMGSRNEKEILIATAIACNVQVIEVVSDFIYKLPQCIFTCKTLVDLTLICCHHNNFPIVPISGTTVFLPKLKKLELKWVRYESEESLVHLLSGCRALEELTILKNYSNVVCVYVSSPTLTRLDLDIPFVEDGYIDDDKVCEVKLDTPALKYLKLHDEMSQNFSVGMLASLTEADIVFHGPAHDVLYSRSVLEFVGKLNNVTCLKLKTDFMEVPDSAFSALSVEFRNLTKFELVGDRRFVTIFLENSINLEVLTICMIDNLQYWIEPKQVPLCLIYRLGTVYFRLHYYISKCLEPGIDMVRYILRNAKVLKTMKIHVSFGRESTENLMKKSEALKRICMFERASETCQLVFV